jgi:hypothetical protein
MSPMTLRAETINEKTYMYKRIHELDTTGPKGLPIPAFATICLFYSQSCLLICGFINVQRIVHPGPPQSDPQALVQLLPWICPRVQR